MKLTVRRCDQSDKEPEKSPATEGQGPRLKPGTPEPDGDSNQERPKDRGTERRMNQKLKAIAVLR